MVLILKFKTLDMVLGACDVVQCQNVGYYTIIFVYGASKKYLSPLDTTKVLQRESLSWDQDMMVVFEFGTLRMVIMTLDMIQGKNNV